MTIQEREADVDESIDHFGVDPDLFRTLEAAGWEVEQDIEGGQPNGIGEIEPSGSREWFTDARETHHRTKYTITGPWEEGPTEWARRWQVGAEQFQRAMEDQTIREAEAILKRRQGEER